MDLTELKSCLTGFLFEQVDNYVKIFLREQSDKEVIAVRVDKILITGCFVDCDREESDFCFEVCVGKKDHAGQSPR